MRTLNLYDNVNGFNNAAGILADKNHFPGIDIVKFGENISIIQKRTTFENISVLDEYEKALAVFKDYYQYEIIQGVDRKKIEKIPEAAFREAIANALIHRIWDVNSHIRVSMFDDRIEVASPGGLPSGITAEGLMKPDFEVSENSIRIVLPLFEQNANLTEDEKVIYKLLSKTMMKPISKIAPYIPFGKSKATKLLQEMGQKGVIAIEGKGRGTKYKIK